MKLALKKYLISDYKIEHSFLLYNKYYSVAHTQLGSGIIIHSGKPSVVIPSSLLSSVYDRNLLLYTLILSCFLHLEQFCITCVFLSLIVNFLRAGRCTLPISTSHAVAQCRIVRHVGLLSECLVDESISCKTKMDEETIAAMLLVSYLSFIQAL